MDRSTAVAPSSKSDSKDDLNVFREIDATVPRVIDNGLPPLVRDATSHVDDVLQGGQQLPGLLQPLPQRPLCAGWTSGRWRSPIYCQVTGNLVHQQLCVNPRWVVDLGFQTTVEVSRHGRRAGDLAARGARCSCLKEDQTADRSQQARRIRGRRINGGRAVGI